MEIAHLHQLIDEKKWTLIFSRFDELLLSRKTYEDNESLISIFESIDKVFREENAQRYYFEMWKVAFEVGKLKLAKSYAEFVLEYLIELKRIPALKKMISELSSTGLLKSHKKFYTLDIILGKKSSVILENTNSVSSHPEMWKDSKNFLREYLLMNSEWKLDDWKLAYEYVLKFYYDKDLFLRIAEKAQDRQRNTSDDRYIKFFVSFLKSKKVNIESLEVKKTITETPYKKAELFVDYDQLAMDVMSGAIEPSVTEQKKILISIQELSEHDLMKKGKDMIVAFGLLGMDKVVVKLCEKIIPLMNEVNERAGIQFMMAQSLFNNGDYHKAIDVVDDIFGEEPLLPDEMLAFNYLKADCWLKLKKYKAAKDLFLSIKKHNPHYRMVGERLRNIEEIK